MPMPPSNWPEPRSTRASRRRCSCSGKALRRTGAVDETRRILADALAAADREEDLIQIAAALATVLFYDAGEPDEATRTLAETRARLSDPAMRAQLDLMDLEFSGLGQRFRAAVSQGSDLLDSLESPDDVRLRAHAIVAWARGVSGPLDDAIVDLEQAWARGRRAGRPGPPSRGAARAGQLQHLHLQRPGTRRRGAAHPITPALYRSPQPQRVHQDLPDGAGYDEGEAGTARRGLRPRRRGEPDHLHRRGRARTVAAGRADPHPERRVHRTRRRGAGGVGPFRSRVLGTRPLACPPQPSPTRTAGCWPSRATSTRRPNDSSAAHDRVWPRKRSYGPRSCSTISSGWGRRTTRSSRWPRWPPMSAAT